MTAGTYLDFFGADSKVPRAVRMLICLLLAVAMLALLVGCQGEVQVATGAAGPVQTIPDDAKGHYCGMYLTEHPGPKAQVLVRDAENPLWFTTVSEVLSFLAAPDEPKAVLAVYVQDMSRRSAAGTFPAQAWIDAHQAWYVMGSRSDMPEMRDAALPFGNREAAESYRREHGGEVLDFAALSRKAPGSEPARVGGAPAYGAFS